MRLALLPGVRRDLTGARPAADTRLVALTNHKEESPVQAPIAESFDLLARMMSHEVRNLLTPIRARAQLALDGPGDPEEMSRVMERFIEIADHIGAVTDTILERAPMVREVVSIVEAAREAVALVGLDRPAGGGCRVVAPTGDIGVLTSRTALRHILMNLMLNAVRVSGEGARVEVSVERSSCSADGRTFPAGAVVIRDHGPGLPTAALGYINKSWGDRDHAGAGGVGLTVVRRLCDLLGATIHAENARHGGAVITLTLPETVERAAA